MSRNHSLRFTLTALISCPLLFFLLLPCNIYVMSCSCQFKIIFVHYKKKPWTKTTCSWVYTYKVGTSAVTLFKFQLYLGYSVINLFSMSVLNLSWLFLIPLLTNFGGINVVLVSGQCQSDQQSLLLQMKGSLIFHPSLSFRMVRWSQSTDCCTWSGVNCVRKLSFLSQDHLSNYQVII